MIVHHQITHHHLSKKRKTIQRKEDHQRITKNMYKVNFNNLKQMTKVFLINAYCGYHVGKETMMNLASQ